MSNPRHRRPTWIKVVFRVRARMADEAAGLLVTSGALGCAVGGLIRPGTRQRHSVRLEAFFDRIGPATLVRLERTMAAAGMLTVPTIAPTLERLSDPGWATIWADSFRPLKVGRRFLIVPPWSPTVTRGRAMITIEPGQAFGTGRHPTTAGMIRAIEGLAASGRFTRALDVGTGSGILAFAMSRAGVPMVVGIDNDPVALENARRNARLNHLEDKVRFSSADLATVRRRFDLIAANILSSTLIDQAPYLIRRLAGGGRLILGGILLAEAADVLRHFVPPLSRAGSRTDRGWITLVLAR